jgi:threonine aldolase
MRAAMAAAEVGDDCYGDDPSVLALEAEVAALLGKEAAVFVPSGTMANQLAVRIHTTPGTCMATHTTAHVRIHEDASAAALSGVQIMPLGSRRGYCVDALRSLCREETCGWPRVALVWLENTLGDLGGAIWPLRPSDAAEPVERDALESIRSWALTEGRPVHLDGARLWNAHIATGHPLPELADVADTVSVAFSKGLGAPLGSALVGTRELVGRARALRHGLGGGLRQAGVVAAAARFALAHHLDRIVDDHRRARRLAEALADLRGIRVRPPETNMVIAEVAPPVEHAEELCAPLRAAGILCHPNVFRELRLVVHLDIDDAALDEIIERARGTIEQTVGRLEGLGA